jgi:hypothetical protein
MRKNRNFWCACNKKPGLNRTPALRLYLRTKAPLNAACIETCWAAQAAPRTLMCGYGWAV